MGKKQEHSSSVAGSDAHIGVRPEELIAKLDGAAEGSRELDAGVLAAIGDWEAFSIEGAPVTADAQPNGWVHIRCGSISWSEGAQPFTTSVDAILALIERELPGWIVESVAQHIFADHRTKGPWRATLRTSPNLPGLEYAQCHYAKTAPLALCIAFLKARSEVQPRAPQEDRPGRVMNPDPALARKEP